MNDKKSWSLFIISLFSLGYGVVAYGSAEIFLRPVEQAFICVCIGIFHHHKRISFEKQLF